MKLTAMIVVRPGQMRIYILAILLLTAITTAAQTDSLKIPAEVAPFVEAGTKAIAIETAETGHLVFGTLHTTTAASTVDRVIDQFPTDRQSQIRIMLSESLKGVIAQTLCKKIGGGRVAALEVLIVTSAMSNLIREAKTFQIPSMMQVGKAHGMVTLNESLMELVTKKRVEPQEAYLKCADKSGFEALLKRAGFDTAFASAKQ